MPEPQTHPWENGKAFPTGLASKEVSKLSLVHLGRLKVYKENVYFSSLIVDIYGLRILLQLRLAKSLFLIHLYTKNPTSLI